MLFWYVAYRGFGTAYRSHLQRQNRILLGILTFKNGSYKPSRNVGSQISTCVV